MSQILTWETSSVVYTNQLDNIEGWFHNGKECFSTTNFVILQRISWEAYINVLEAKANWHSALGH